MCAGSSLMPMASHLATMREEDADDSVDCSAAIGRDGVVVACWVCGVIAGAFAVDDRLLQAFPDSSLAVTLDSMTLLSAISSEAWYMYSEVSQVQS